MHQKNNSNGYLKHKYYSWKSTMVLQHNYHHFADKTFFVWKEAIELYHI